VITVYFENEDLEDGKLYEGKSLSDALDELVDRFRSCYVEDQKLRNFEEELGQSTGKVLENLFLPEKPAIKSGDFGEILTFLLFSDEESSSDLLAPKKWRWKGDKNDPAPHTDIVLLFHDRNEQPSEHDRVMSAEVKAKATKPRGKSPIQKAVNGAAKDRNTRLAKTLAWMERRFKKESEFQKAEIVARFTKSYKTKTFQKDYRAVSVIDSDFLEAELRNEPDKPEDSDDRVEPIGLHFVAVPSLKQTYEEVFNRLGSDG
jgi:hypothetical protein